jgi:hypothetical protein
MLLDIEAVHFNAEEPFTFASGLRAPTYIDCRKLISYPRIRSALMDFLTCRVMEDAGFEAFDNVAGRRDRGHPLRRAGGRADGAADELRAQEAQGLRPQRPDRGRDAPRASGCCWSRT